MRPKNREIGVPLYTQVARLLRAEVGAGRYEVGSQISSIEDLSREYDVGISTIRQAISALEAEGLLERIHGRGTFVRGTPQEMRWLPLAVDWASLFRNIEELEPRQLLEEEVDELPNLGNRDGKLASKYRYMQRMHERNGAPFSIVNIYLDEDIFQRSPDRFRREIVLPILLEMQDVQMDCVRQTFMVDGADQDQARLLQIGFGAPIATLHRTIQNKSGTAIYVADVVYRGDVVRLDIDLNADPKTKLEN